MAVSEDVGGDGASLVDLTLVLECLGGAVAPVPLVENFVVRRAAASCNVDLPSGVLAFAPIPVHAGAEPLVPAGAVASMVLGLVGDRLVLDVLPEVDAPPVNLGGVPIGRWSAPERSVGEVWMEGKDACAAHARALAEWRVLTAAALVGLGQGALDLGVRYANERTAFEVQIGSFQAISHPLVDVAVAVEGARRLTWKAAWFLDNEPAAAPQLSAMAFLHSARTASLAARTSIHTQGGFGFTLESDVQLYFRRAKGWVLPAGDPSSLLATIADHLYGPMPKERS
jgi:hypothetical protein